MVAKVVGVGGFELFRHGAIQLDVLAPEHPICAGLQEPSILEDDDPVFRKLLFRGVAWAAGEDPLRFGELVAK